MISAFELFGGGVDVRCEGELRMVAGGVKMRIAEVADC